MRTGRTYQVLETKNDNLKPSHAKVFQKLKKGEQFESHDIIARCRSIGLKDGTIYSAISTGLQVGILKQIKVFPIEFSEFKQLETIVYFSSQTRGSKLKNLKITGGLGSTREQYLYRLWNFNNWLHGRDFTFKKTQRTGIDTLKEITQTITLDGLEHLLKLYQESNESSSFVKLIKMYLLDPIHAEKRASSVALINTAIMSYFERNDSPISFKFDPKATYKSTTDEDEKPMMSLEDVLKMLTLGTPTPMEKALVLCKFHRGLDNSTLADRFNFNAWEQLVEYFGTEQFENWNTELCPVPIKLLRIKTEYMHIGMLDVDAINALKDYLKVRYEKTGNVMKKGEAIFLNQKKKPVSSELVSRIVRKLARKSGIQRKLADYNLVTRYEKDSHELRDLLKSTLIDSEVRLDICDHVIGHKVKDTYEKQHELYPDTIRVEYQKASQRLNIFSNVTQYMENTHADRKLQAQIDQLKRQLEQEQSKLKKESDETTMLIQSNHEIQKLIALEVRKQLKG
jgi:hypothetical protein